MLRRTPMRSRGFASMDPERQREMAARSDAARLAAIT